MKKIKIYFIFAFCLPLVFASNCANGQSLPKPSASGYDATKVQTNNNLSASDLSSIVKKCIDLPALQSFYHINVNGNLNQVDIVNYPYDFGAEVSVTGSGNSANFISNESFSERPATSYFMFRHIKRNGSNVNLIGNYYYVTNGAKANKSIAITYSNSTGTWTIINYTIN